VVIPVPITTMLRSSDPAVRRQGWTALWEHRAELELGQRAITDLEDLACDEPLAQVGTFALGVIDGIRRRRNACLQERLWEPFDSRRARPSTKESVVLAVTDGTNYRDAHSLVTLAQLVPDSRDVRFLSIPSVRPDWGQIQISSLRSVCLVGRPLMYRGFGLSPALPKDLRFAFPGGDLMWRGRPMSKRSIDEYHHLEQRWKGKTTRRWEPHEEFDAAPKTRIRVDYAVAQRFPVTFGGDTIIVMILGGATSLGTAGAVSWATGSDTAGEAFRSLERRGGPIVDSTRIEALIEVTADVEQPRRPWRPRVKLEKLFIDDSPNLVTPFPGTITLAGGSAGAGKVRDIFFDGDGVSLAEDDFAALVALCLAADRGAGVANVADVIRDQNLWPNGRVIRPWVKPEQARQYYLDTFQRILLNGCLHLSQRMGLKLDSKVELT
jgi:hypothetical protein